MSSIRILSDRVANQIAAGEVIERPAAVVKELIENSLDAGATRIEVEFRQGGRSYIRIEDNGCGMSQDDALMSLERHGTSKMTETNDLQRIVTFGFRGEAIPSIASVSRFVLQTRKEGAEHGTEILVNGGKFVHVRECGVPVGTRIEVNQLFNSVPARRKFLKTDATESAHIIQCARLHAIAHPGVGFKVIENDRTVFQSGSCPDLGQRLAEIFGRGLGAILLPLKAEEGGMTLSGFIGRPAASRATRHELLTFVNSRPVESRTLGYAVLESYHNSLPKGRYPVAFLFLGIDPAGVDVNVHPAKREVRFREESRVRSFVIRAVLARLREEEGGVEVESGNEAGAALTQPLGRATGAIPAGPGPEPWSEGAAKAGGVPVSGAAGGHDREEGAKETPAQSVRRVEVSVGRASNPAPGGRFDGVLPSAEPLRKPMAPASPHLGSAGGGTSVAPGGASANGGSKATVPSGQRYDWRWRFIGQARGSLALFETGAGLVVMDRRAAHERLMYEDILEQFRKGEARSQGLLFPVPLELDPVATALLADHLEFINGNGFEISVFGRNFFRIEAVPPWLEPSLAEPFVRDLLAVIREKGLPEHQPELARERIALLAAGKAIRVSDRVTEEEIVALARRLMKCETPLTSPLGRSTFFEMGAGEIEKRLQR